MELTIKETIISSNSTMVGEKFGNQGSQIHKIAIRSSKIGNQAYNYIS